jgi:hypothetical protein
MTDEGNWPLFGQSTSFGDHDNAQQEDNKSIQHNAQRKG